MAKRGSTQKKEDARFKKNCAKYNNCLRGRCEENVRVFVCLWMCGLVAMCGAVQTLACWAERRREAW